MDPINRLNITTRAEFRQWLIENHATAKECFVACKRGRPVDEDRLWYLDAVEEALCFGWIDSTVRKIDGVSVQRFSPRRKGGNWTELNKERVRRLEKLGLMTDAGRAVLPDLSDSGFVIDEEIYQVFQAHPAAWERFQSFPTLYQRVRIDSIQRDKKKDRAVFEKRLEKLITQSEAGKMFGEWNDCGRLLNYK